MSRGFNYSPRSPLFCGPPESTNIMPFTLDVSPILRDHQADVEHNLKSSSPSSRAEVFESSPGRVCFAMHLDEEESSCRDSDKDLIDMNTPFLERCSKRKRGFYPYAEDEEDLVFDNIPPLATASLERAFEDLPRYPWIKRSFSSPEEKVKSFTVPELKAEDKIFGSLKETESEVHVKNNAAVHIEFDENACQQCGGHVDSNVLAEAEKFTSLAPLSTYEKWINFGVEWVCDWGTWLNKECAKTRGMSLLSSSLTLAFDAFCSYKAEQPRVKRRKIEDDIASIPANAQWPPTRTSQSWYSPSSLESRSKTLSAASKVTLSRSVKDYLNRRYDDFVMECKSRGVCVCNLQMRISVSYQANSSIPKYTLQE
jgi:hypothetical protein